LTKSPRGSRVSGLEAEVEASERLTQRQPRQLQGGLDHSLLAVLEFHLQEPIQEGVMRQGVFDHRAQLSLDLIADVGVAEHPNPATKEHLKSGHLG
jgi:hypothetical protein